MRQCEQEKYMLIRKQYNTRINLSLNIGQYNFGRVQHFKYLEIVLIEYSKTVKKMFL